MTGQYLQNLLGEQMCIRPAKTDLAPIIMLIYKLCQISIFGPKLENNNTAITDCSN